MHFRNIFRRLFRRRDRRHGGALPPSTEPAQQPPSLEEYEPAAQLGNPETVPTSASRGRQPLLVLPSRVRARIYELVLVQDHKISVCGCRHCPQISSYLALTQVCGILRSDTLPVFYGQNQFYRPLHHFTRRHYFEWLRAVGPSLQFIQYLQVPCLNVDEVVLGLDSMRMRLLGYEDDEENWEWRGYLQALHNPVFGADLSDAALQECLGCFLRPPGSLPVCDHLHAAGPRDGGLVEGEGEDQVVAGPSSHIEVVVNQPAALQALEEVLRQRDEQPT